MHNIKSPIRHVLAQAQREVVLFTRRKLVVGCFMALMIGVGRWRFGRITLTWRDLGHDLLVVFCCYVFVVIGSFCWNVFRAYVDMKWEDGVGQIGTLRRQAFELAVKVCECAEEFQGRSGGAPSVPKPGVSSMEEWQAYNRWVARFRAYFVGNLGGTVEALILSFQGAGQIARGNFAVNALANVNSPDNALRLAAEIFAMGMAVAWDTHSQGGPEGRSDIRPPIL